MILYVLSTHYFIDHQSRFFFFVQKTDYDFSGPFAYLRNHLSDFVQVVHFDAQEAQNEFAWQFDTLKKRFIVFTKVLF
jgi:hypothetical protein